MDEIFKKYFSYVTRKDSIELTAYQKRLISLFLQKDNISIIKKRQMGFTTSIISYVLFLIESNSNKKDISIITYNKAQKENLMNILANYLLSSFEKEFVRKISFSYGVIKIFDYNISIINSIDLIKNYSLRGCTPDLLIVDEAEFIGEKSFIELESLFLIILSRKGQVICSSSISKFDKSRSFQKRHFKGLQLSNIYKRNIILEKKQKKSFYEFETPFSIDLREVF